MRNYVWPLFAIIIMFDEVATSLHKFYEKTIWFFSYSGVSMSYLVFLDYMSSVMIILTLFYLFIGLWSKLESPLVSIGKLSYDVFKNFNISKINIENKIWLFLVSTLLLVSISFFTWYLFWDYSTRTYVNIYDILSNIISIASFFYVSKVWTSFISSSAAEFLEHETGFWKIWIGSFIYISVLWLFYIYTHIVMTLIERLVSVVIK